MPNNAVYYLVLPILSLDGYFLLPYP